MKTILPFMLAVAGLTLVSACKEKSPPSPAAGSGDKGVGQTGTQTRDAHTDEVRLSAEAVARHGIKTEPVVKHVLTPTLLAPARVSFNTEAMAHVGSPLRGRVTELKVKAGDPVKKGDVLLVIESPELGEAQSDYLQKRSAVASTLPAVDLAKNAYERAKGLYDKSQGIALTEVQRREVEFRAAQAALNAAQNAATGAENKLHLFGMDQRAVDMLATSGEVAPHFSVTAPIEGHVIEREVTLGELVSPEKESLIVLADTRTLWVLADVSETRLAEITVGAKVRVTVGTGEGAMCNGAVAFISPAVDPATRSAQVRIEVREGQLALRPGMFAKVEIDARQVGQAQATPVLAVPDEAVQTVEGGSAVFIPVAGEPNRFMKRSVRVGKAIGGFVPVLSGLKEGESVVVAGSFILKADLGKGSAEEE